MINPKYLKQIQVEMKNSIANIILVLIVFLGGSGCGNKNIRTSIHFSLQDSALTKPVEIICVDDVYHLYYTYSIDGKSKKWGQVESKDLQHWNNVPMRIESATENNIKSILVDWSYLTKYSNEKPGLIAFCSNDDKSGELSLLFSHDNGLTWNEDSDVSILLDGLSDPIMDLKVFWNDNTQKWNMLVLSGYQVQFYSSDDLKEWEYVSRFGDDVYLKSGEWTSVDFFPMEVEKTGVIKWILTISADKGSPNEGSGVQYFVGDYDGFAYVSSHNKPKWIDHGSDIYQTVVLSDYYTVNKQPVLIGSIYNSIYQKFNLPDDAQTEFSLVRKLSLIEKFNDLYLIQQPTNLAESNSASNTFISGIELADQKQIEEKAQLPIKIDLKFNVDNRLYLGMAEVFGVKISNDNGQELIVGYQAERRYFFISDPSIQKNYPDTWDGFNYAPYVTNEPQVDMTLIIDQKSVELFAMEGLVGVSRKFVFEGDVVDLQFFGKNGSISLQEGKITELK